MSEPPVNPDPVPVVIPAKTIKHVDRCVQIHENPFDYELGFTPREFIQTTLPYRKPAGNPEAWIRKNGNFTLVIRPGYDPEKECVMDYPTGSIPRLLLCYLATEAIRTNKSRIEFSGSFANFLRLLHLDPSRGGPRSDAQRLRTQMRNLFMASINFHYSEDSGFKSWLNMQVAPKGQVWWSELYPDSPTLSENWIELGEDFFQAICAHSVPLDMRVLTAPKIKDRPMAIDLYAWASSRAYSAWKNNQDVKVPWSSLKQQRGTEYARLRDFRIKVVSNLRLVRTVYPDLQLDVEPDKDYLGIKKGSRPSVWPEKLNFQIGPK